MNICTPFLSMHWMKKNMLANQLGQFSSYCRKPKCLSKYSKVPGCVHFNKSPEVLSEKTPPWAAAAAIARSRKLLPGPKRRIPESSHTRPWHADTYTSLSIPVQKLSSWFRKINKVAFTLRDRFKNLVRKFISKPIEYYWLPRVAVEVPQVGWMVSPLHVTELI